MAGTGPVVMAGGWCAGALLRCSLALRPLGTRPTLPLLAQVCLDRHAPAYYTESTEEAAASTESFINYVRAKGMPRLQPAIIPRFLPTCTPQLLGLLGRLAEQHGVAVSSHISESYDEAAFSQQLETQGCSEAEVFDAAGLLRPQARWQRRGRAAAEGVSCCCCAVLLNERASECTSCFLAGVAWSHPSSAASPSSGPARRCLRTACCWAMPSWHCLQRGAPPLR